MAISPELVGRTYPAIELYTVSREAVRAVGTGAMVTFRTEITDRQGQPVSTARSSLLVRGDDQ